jgi:hypothetical protein
MADRSYSGKAGGSNFNEQGAGAMILTTAKAWNTDLKQWLKPGPRSAGRAVSTVALGSYVCFGAAGLMLWLGDSRSAFAALAAVPVFGVGLIMHTCSVLMRTEQPATMTRVTTTTDPAVNPIKDREWHQTAAE